MSSFSVRYAIPMNGPGCARDVREKLQSLGAVEAVEIDLSNQEAVVAGKVPPSDVVNSMQAIGRDAFIRGSGLPNSAAVAVLEDTSGKVKGLARVLEVAAGETLFDVTVDADHAGTGVSVFSFGDLSNPPLSLGSVLFKVLNLPKPKHETAHAWTTIDKTPLANLIGRSVHTDSGLSGIIARSAGLWENDKTVCSCDGKTLWDERKDFRQQTNGHL